MNVHKRVSNKWRFIKEVLSRIGSKKTVANNQEGNVKMFTLIGHIEARED